MSGISIRAKTGQIPVNSRVFSKRKKRRRIVPSNLTPICREKRPEKMRPLTPPHRTMENKCLVVDKNDVFLYATSFFGVNTSKARLEPSQRWIYEN